MEHDTNMNMMLWAGGLSSVNMIQTDQLLTKRFGTTIMIDGQTKSGRDRSGDDPGMIRPELLLNVTVTVLGASLSSSKTHLRRN